tara:strand:+ start:7273 stop:7695 length:423 start_codon:yes stop_codon:yes gene_type:complete
MPLHLIKLAVGIEHIDHLKERQSRFINDAGNAQHTTRMFPKRSDALLDDGSMFWVIKRMVLVRQQIIALHKGTNQEGRSMCVIELAPHHIYVQPQRKRPFQGWRYLKPGEAPKDIADGDGYIDPDMPDDMRAELSRIGLI